MPKINLTLDTHNQVIMNGASRINVPAETINALTTAVERQAIAESASAVLAPRPKAAVPTPSLLMFPSTLSKAPPNGISNGTDIPAGGQLSAVQSDITRYLTDGQ
jgi:hypothetical protein